MEFFFLQSRGVLLKHRLQKLGYKSSNSFSSLKRQIPSQSTNGSYCIRRDSLSFRRRRSIVEEVEIMATFELYRRSTIGMCLTETLDEMVQSGTLSPELAIQVLVQFDKSMTEALESQVKTKVSIKGHLHTYRFCDNVWTFILQDAMFKNDDRQENVSRVKIVACDSKLLTHCHMSFLPLQMCFHQSRREYDSSAMATSKSHSFQLIEGMELQITVTGLPNGSSVRTEFHLKNCNRTWILHWGCIYQGNNNWFVPSEHSTKQGALQTPFVKSGNDYVVILELRDPEVRAVEFVLKDGNRNRWLKQHTGNFRVEIPWNELHAHHRIPKNLIERRAYTIWDRKGRPQNTAREQQMDYENAIRELQADLARGISIDDLQANSSIPVEKAVISEPKQTMNLHQPSHRRKHDVQKWLQKYAEPITKNASVNSSALAELLKKSVGQENVVSQKSFHIRNYEIAVLQKNVNGDCRLYVATNMAGPTVLHWGVAKSSAGEWLTPPPDVLPEKSKIVHGACQTYFTDMSSREHSYQLIVINFKRSGFVGIQFVIWSGSHWVNNNGANFAVNLISLNSTGGKLGVDGKYILKWLLDEIAEREKEAERSLMHRFNIATELTERCKDEGEGGCIGIMVWMKFMATRHLTWNKNYNVKPREISEALERFTNLMEKIYLQQPYKREIVRLTMALVGRGGQGDVGQRIRDEILVIQRNNHCKSGMMEEWHQKLHNNSSADDVIICEALLNYVRSDFKIDAYWKTLKANGLTKERLASYDRPILSEPRFKSDAKEGLIRDLTMYLKTLKAVHSGADLESAIDTFLSPAKGHNVFALNGLSPKLQAHFLHSLTIFSIHISVKRLVREENTAPLIEKLVDARIELHPALRAPRARAKDLLFLDIALESCFKTTIEKRLISLNFNSPPEVVFVICVVLENLCLSTFNNEEDCYRVSETYKAHDVEWALQTKAVLDRLQLVLADRCQHYLRLIQPSANYLGQMLRVDKHGIDVFTEEVVRAGPGAVLSTLVNRFDPCLRKIANLGCWQVISSADAYGFLVCVNELITVQSKVYSKPTVIIASKVTGEEEIPDGVVAVLTPSLIDVLSHVSIRARNSKACTIFCLMQICFATCFDQNVLKNLKSKEGREISIHINSTGLVISDGNNSDGHVRHIYISSVSHGVVSKRKKFCSNYVISSKEFTSEMVGSKSCNIKFLRERVPSWIKIPTSVALPFGTFECALSDDSNKDVAHKISALKVSLNRGDMTKLKAIQEAVLQMNAPIALKNELIHKLRSERMSYHGDESSWNRSWMAIKKVWASKWNERAYVSCKKTRVDHDAVCMAVLVQEVICGDYAFVIHTNNPVTGDPSEIYTEIVKGLGETLVGGYPGRAMSFITKKTNLKSPTVISYPSKRIGLYSKPSVIFRSDSNNEDLEGYAGAGLYDSVIMDEAEEVMVDYSREQLIVDKAFQVRLFSAIAEAGNVIETLYGCPQDIEGVVKGGIIYVVQARPQL
ncbi:BnaA01g35130D [Brassica napus]|uniref:BnaA01g35130D protein n=1 Tax=Brassica napus TaxID=3708 RepID=A0A078J880_BRANA|nr:BnaA01g35130D [Brassica napus]